MKTYFFVESPIQLLNAYEAKCYFNIESDCLFFIRLSGVERNDRQMIFLVDFFDIKNVSYTIMNAENKNLLDYVKLFYYRYFYRLKNYNKIFIGNLHSGFFTVFMKKANKEKIVLLDDGSKTVGIQKQFTSSNYYNLFSIYNLNAVAKQIIYKNDFLHVKNRLMSLQTNTNQVMFIGSKIAEIGIIEKKQYIKLMKKIADYYHDKEILYISHREESQDKLAMLSKVHNISVVSLEYPVELYGFYENVLPYKVSSFYSTALLTMKSIYDVQVECFRFDCSDSNYKQGIESVYKYHRKFMKEIDLDA